MPLIYCFVARANTVLAEYSPYHGNFKHLALQCLERLDPVGTDPAKITITCDKHTFNFLRREGFSFLVVADEAYGRQIPFAFLDRISEDFVSTTSSKFKTAGSHHALDRVFGPRMKQHMEFCVSNPDEVSQVAGVQKKVDEVKNIMVENVEKVLQRGERIELLVDKTDDLRNQAQIFQKQGKQLRSRMWWQNLRMKIIVVVAVLLLAVVIFLLACFAGGQNCVKKHQH